ncbi:uncharacterized protein AB675_11780 [Cyphellophora attinorum]|uniref:Uncharacterized protein n=1 Tax=Cyphellophora attinorum TaxID=1664694 RepID=A0A0N0NJF2_9EURO|nr:uncharacterized protein AB675_11780 [Phialophora attinorum]KPI36838.1 hypothetical protein AB675_11780 [Phialophora attinorum]
MSKIPAAPAWDKPNPNLNTMPTEILKKIIGYTVPDNLDINITNVHRIGMTSISWSPEWVSNLRLVSRRIRKVVLVAMVKNCGIHFTMGEPEVRKMLKASGESIRGKMKEWVKSQYNLSVGEEKTSLGGVVHKVVSVDLAWTQVVGDMAGWELTHSPETYAFVWEYAESRIEGQLQDTKLQTGGLRNLAASGHRVNMYVILSSAVIAPPWDKRKPELGSMPFEILEKIVAFAIGQTVSIEMSFKGRGPLAVSNTLHGAIKWYQARIPNLLLTSKRFRRVTQSLLPKLDTQLIIEVQNADALNSSMERDAFARSRTYRLALRHFMKLVGTVPDKQWIG